MRKSIVRRPLGLAAPLLCAVDVEMKLDQQFGPRDTVLFSSALGMLDLTAGAEPLECMDLAKMKLAASQLTSQQDVSSMAKSVNIYAGRLNEIRDEKSMPENLRRIDGDAQTDALVLAA